MSRQIEAQNDDLGTCAVPELDKYAAVVDACVIDPAELPAELKAAAVAAFGPEAFELTTSAAAARSTWMSSSTAMAGPATRRRRSWWESTSGSATARASASTPRACTSTAQRPSGDRAGIGGYVIRVDTGRGGKAVYRVPKRVLGAG